MDTLQVVECLEQFDVFRLRHFDHEFLLVFHWIEFHIDSSHQKMNEFNMKQNMHGREMLQIIEKHNHEFDVCHAAVDSENHFYR